MREYMIKFPGDPPIMEGTPKQHRVLFDIRRTKRIVAPVAIRDVFLRSAVEKDCNCLDIGRQMRAHEKETILFVDDEESLLDIAKTYFSGRGYRVLTAANGQEAIDAMVRERIDCCFTDINMPEMDGLELAEYMRSYDNTIPVVVMTGFPSLDNTITTLKNGVVDFLIKPINLQQMELCLQRVLRERRLFVENIILAKEVEGKAKLEKLNSELLSKNEELHIINRIQGDFSALRESADVFSQLVDLTVEITKADAADFYLINENSRQPVSIASSQSAGVQSSPFEVSNPSECLQSQDNNGCDPKVVNLIDDVLKEHRPLLIAKQNNGNSYLPQGTLSYMMVPLKIRSKLFGVLSASVLQGKVRFSQKDLYYLSVMTNNAATAIENLALYENIYHNLLATLYAFVKAIEARDPYTKEHSNRVTRLAIAMAKELGCSIEEQEILNVAGMLHDIGKIGIRDEILLKPGRLTEEEYKVIQQHPVIGAEIMNNLGLWNRERQIVRSHHERFDGRGYPDQLASDEIPLLARILSIADVYDAIASDRAYRVRMEEAKILEIMYSGAGSQFDPKMIGIFRKLYESGEVNRLLDD
jgi:putative nucleotidyltransferase with HDIG domain